MCIEKELLEGKSTIAHARLQLTVKQTVAFFNRNTIGWRSALFNGSNQISGWSGITIRISFVLSFFFTETPVTGFTLTGNWYNQQMARAWYYVRLENQDRNTNKLVKFDETFKNKPNGWWTRLYNMPREKENTSQYWSFTRERARDNLDTLRTFMLDIGWCRWGYNWYSLLVLIRRVVRIWFERDWNCHRFFINKHKEMQIDEEMPKQ